MCLRPISVDHLGGNQFLVGGIISTPLRRGQRARIDTGKGTRGLDPHRTDGIAQQGSDLFYDRRGGPPCQHRRRRETNEWLGVADRRLDGELGCGRGVGGQRLQGTGACDCWRGGVTDQRVELRLGIRQPGPSDIQREAIVGRGLPTLRKPRRDRLRRPVRGLIRVALGAGVGDANRHRQVRTRHPEAVIAPQVYTHVGLRRHVAVDALRAGAILLVVMVLCDVELLRHVALCAQ